MVKASITGAFCEMKSANTDWDFTMQALAKEVACYLGMDLSPIKIKRFADGEIYVAVEVRSRPFAKRSFSRAS